MKQNHPFMLDWKPLLRRSNTLALFSSRATGKASPAPQSTVFIQIPHFGADRGKLALTSVPGIPAALKEAIRPLAIG